MAKRLQDPTRTVERMIANANNNAQQWLENTLNPSVDPVEAAVTSNDRYKSSMQQALSEDRWVKGMRTVDKGAMQAAIREGGTSAYTSGITKRRAKIEAAVRKMAPLQQSVMDKVGAMSRTTLQDRKNRMLANVDLMIEAGKQYRGT